MTRQEVAKFAKFLVVGGLSSIVSLAVRALANQVMIFEAAVVVAQIAGAFVAFTLNLLFVFKGFEGSRGASFARFLVVNVGSLLIATGVSSVLYRLVLDHEGRTLGGYIAHFCGLGAACVPSYLGHKYFSFRSKPADAPQSAGLGFVADKL